MKSTQVFQKSAFEELRYGHGRERFWVHRLLVATTVVPEAFFVNTNMKHATIVVCNLHCLADIFEMHVILGV
jgi:hypothetical protein